MRNFWLRVVQALAVAGSGGAIVPVPAAAQTPPVLRGGAISESDYPGEALAHRHQGRVVMELTIDPRGRTTGCRILETSGSPLLDRGSCDFWSRRMRYRAARDADGRPAEGRVVQELAWMIDAPCPAMSQNGVCVTLD